MFSFLFTIIISLFDNFIDEYWLKRLYVIVMLIDLNVHVRIYCVLMLMFWDVYVYNMIMSRVIYTFIVFCFYKHTINTQIDVIYFLLIWIKAMKYIMWHYTSMWRCKNIWQCIWQCIWHVWQWTMLWQSIGATTISWTSLYILWGSVSVSELFRNKCYCW